MILLTHEELIKLAKNSVVDWWKDTKEYIDIWGDVTPDLVDVMFETTNQSDSCFIIGLKVFSIGFIFKYHERLKRCYLDVYDVVCRNLIVLD